MKVKQIYIQSYKKPYPCAKNPENGYNGLLADECKSHAIEIKANGVAEVDGVQMEFVDLRVYIGTSSVDKDS